ncbi:RebB family R body protein [Thalassovita sp.]|uniref:RebB family R body protein n=1 Tax=Thalassovita sp. TaxID=1979401 RepID=UPI002AB1B6E1|nr:RebB family R body protein [Thalassovita sp.]
MAKKDTATETPGVNEQITDAVTQANVKVLSEGPAMAMGNLYQSLAHSTGIMMENAVAAQHQANITTQAATNQGVMMLYSIDDVASEVSAERLAGFDDVKNKRKG